MRFFIKALVGLFAVIGVLGTLVLGVAVVTVSRVMEGEDPPLPKRMVLTLTVSGPLAEDSSRGLSLPFVDPGEEAPGLADVTQALAAAATDPAVTGLLVRLEDGPLGMAQAQEVRNAVTAFRLSGKPAHVFSESMGNFTNGTVPYFIASAFDRVTVQPSGLVGITGFAMEVPYARGLLDDLGLVPQFETRKDFKTAPETLTDYAMSRAAFTANRAVVEGWTGQVVRAIAAGRGLSPGAVRAAIDRAPLLAPEAQEAGLVDALAYGEEADAAMTEAAGTEERIPLAAYAARLAEAETPEDARRVILMMASGPVVIGDGEHGPFDPEEIDARALASAIDAAVEDPEAAALVLRINSPGGSYLGSDIVHRAVTRARERGMPVIASMGDAAASGGYFIAMGASRIVAQPGTLTGSIGAFAGKIAFGPASEDLGIAWDGVSVGRNATMFSGVKPFDPAGEARLSAILDAIYADFTAKAAEARGLTPQALEQVARGRVWTGEDALAQGLVDDLGGLAEALAVAREEAGLDPSIPLEIIIAPEPAGPGDLLRALSRMEGVESLGGLRAVATLVRLAALLDPLVRAADPLVRGLAPVAVPLAASGEAVLTAPTLPGPH